MTAVSADALIGTWRLKSFVREITGTGERYDSLGAHPHGFQRDACAAAASYLLRNVKVKAQIEKPPRKEIVE
jgi:hypothetical protein